MLNKKFFAILLLGLLVSWSLLALPVLAQEDEETPTGQDDKVLACCEKEAKTTDGSKGAITTENITEKSCNDLKTTLNNSNWYRNKIAAPDKKSCTDKPNNLDARNLGDPIYFTPQVSVPGSDFTSGNQVKVRENTSLIIDYIIAIYKYSIGVIGIIAAIVLMYGGIRWLTAGGNSGAIGEAKTWIAGSLAGLLLALCSFLLLSTINTQLVNIPILSVKKIQKTDLTNGGCCEKTAQDGTKTAANATSAECEEIKKKDMNENGYKNVEFFIGYKAENNQCKQNTGCCLLDIGTQIAFLEWPWGDKQICMQNIKQADCSAAETSGTRNWIPFIGTTSDQDAKMFLGKKCQDVPDCQNNFICETERECNAKLQEIQQANK